MTVPADPPSGAQTATELSVHESGRVGSEAIVFVHADGVSGRMWADHMDAFADYHCLAPDLPGFGHSNSIP